MEVHSPTILRKSTATHKAVQDVFTSAPKKVGEIPYLSEANGHARDCNIRQAASAGAQTFPTRTNFKSTNGTLKIKILAFPP